MTGWLPLFKNGFSLQHYWECMSASCLFILHGYFLLNYWEWTDKNIMRKFYLESDKETWFLADLSSFHAIPIYSQRKCKLKWSTINPWKDISALGPADTSDIQWTTSIKHLVSQYSLDAITMDQSNSLDEAFNLKGFKNHIIPVTKLRDLQLRKPLEDVLQNEEKKITLSQDNVQL